MIPKAAEGINHVIMRVAMDLVPKAPSAYVGADLSFLAALMSMIAQDYDRVADVLVTEHPVMVDLLRAAQPHIEDAALRTRIEEALGKESASLRIPELMARADAVMRVLIDVHAEVERREGEAWADALNARIWAFLDSFAASRAYELAF